MIAPNASIQDIGHLTAYRVLLLHLHLFYHIILKYFYIFKLYTAGELIIVLWDCKEF